VQGLVTEKLCKVMSPGHECGMAIPLVPACKKQNSEERSLALQQKPLCFTKAALKVKTPTLIYWPVTSGANVDGMAIRTEPSHQYSITFCYHVTDGSKGAV